MKRIFSVIILLACFITQGVASPMTNEEKEWLEFVKTTSPDLLPQEEYLTLYRAFFPNLTPVENPELIILGGGPGSGKTTYRKTHLNDRPQFHLHDMDEVLILLPSYKKSLEKSGAHTAFEENWPTAQTVANQLVAFAFNKHFNVIYDRTCGSDASFQNLEDAITNKGYKATLYAFYVGEQTALERVKTREKLENRAMSPEITKEYTSRFSTLFPQYLAFIPEVTLFDSDQKICFEKRDGVSRIIEQTLYDEFLGYRYQKSG